MLMLNHNVFFFLSHILHTPGMIDISHHFISCFFLFPRDFQRENLVAFHYQSQTVCSLVVSCWPTFCRHIIRSSQLAARLISVAGPGWFTTACGTLNRGTVERTPTLAFEMKVCLKQSDLLRLRLRPSLK